MTSHPDRGMTYFRHSEVIEIICTKFLNETFTVEDLKSLTPLYTSSVHKVFTTRGLLVLQNITREPHKQLYHPNGTKNGMSFIRVRHYKFSKDLKEWYIETYVYCNGTGVIAKRNREKIKLQSQSQLQSTITTT